MIEFEDSSTLAGHLASRRRRRSLPPVSGINIKGGGATKRSPPEPLLAEPETLTRIYTVQTSGRSRDRNKEPLVASRPCVSLLNLIIAPVYSSPRLWE